MHDFNIRRFGKQMAGFVIRFLAILCFVIACQFDANVYFNPLSHFQTGDFSVSLKASGHNKHFRVHVEAGMYCMGQREFVSLQHLVDHYQVKQARREQVMVIILFFQREPIYTSQQGEKLFLIKPLLGSSNTPI